MLIDDDDVEEAIAYLDFEPTTTDVSGLVWMCLVILSVAFVLGALFGWLAS